MWDSDFKREMADFCQVMTLQLMAERVAREAGDHALREVLVMETDPQQVLPAWERRRRWWQDKIVLRLGDKHPALAERIHEWTAIAAYSEEDETLDRKAGYKVGLYD